MEGPESDLAQLWQTAVEEYEKRTKKKLGLGQFGTIEEVIKGTESLSNNFKDFRHDKSKTDKVRSAFKNNLWLIQKVVNTVQMVGNAASAFPPAMPASLIFSAFGQVMQTFGQMSADYDKIMGFFDFTHRFLDRLSMIQDKTPKLAPFRRCVARVFSSMLTICAVAQEYIKEKRMKRWFNTMLDGSDSALGGAYKEMEGAINELGQAVGLATLRTVEIIANLVQSMTDDVEFIVTKVTILDERSHATLSNTNVMMKQSQEMSSKQDVLSTKQETILEMQRELIRKFTEQSKSHERAQEKEKSQPGQKKSKTDPADKKRDALNQIKACFTQYSDWSVVSKEAKIQRREIKSIIVDGTGAWLFEEKGYDNWVNDVSPILYLRGIAGIGKSFLAYTVVSAVETSLKERKNATSACFFFREEQHALQSWREALFCLAFQIAEQNPKYGEALASDLSNIDEEELWVTLFASKFPEKGEGCAYLVIDGIDEMQESERTYFCECLRQIKDDNLRIHVFLAGRALSFGLELLDIPTIDVTTEKLTTDIQKVIVAGCKSLPRLRKFRKPVKNVILKRLRNKADGMRYVEHMLRRLSYIGREGAVLADLEKNLPDSLESLYKLMLTECQKDRTDEQYQALKKLFAWLAYSKRALTLGQASELVALTVANERVFDIEDELIGRSARILELRYDDDDDYDDEEWEKRSDGPEESSGDGEIDIKDNRKSPLTFQERSLRDYFRAIDVDERGLRTPPSAAHLTIFEMATSMLFKDCGRPNYQNEQNLMSYAANFWIEHFAEIDPTTATDQEIIRVLNVFYRVLSNDNNTAQSMEYFGTRVYSEMHESGASWLNKLKEWTDRAATLDSGRFSPKVQTWAEGYSVSQAMMPLARGHVENWYRECFGHAISNCFKFARDALGLSGLELSGKTLDTVLKVANQFPDIEKTAGSMRAISAILNWFGINEESMKYAQQGLEMLKEDDVTPLRFYLTRSISVSNANLGNYSEAVSEIEKSVSVLPANWKEDQDLVGAVERVYVEKAQYFQVLEKPDDAIAAYNDSRSVNPKTALNGSLLHDITRVFNDDRDPNCSKLLGLLKSWEEKERLAWLEYIFTDDDTFGMTRLNQIVALQGTEGKESVLRWFEQYIKVYSARPDKLVVPRSALARCYREVINDELEARKLYMQVMKSNLHDYDISGLVEEELSNVGRELADMIFTEFCASKDPVQKAALLQEMKNLRTLTNAGQGEIHLLESNVSVMMATMTRVMGPTIEYQATMEKIFNTCIDGLTDSVGWNDMSCFRLLAKVLSFMEGLERDALIAISCQFSRVTESTEDGGGNSEGSAEDSLDVEEELGLSGAPQDPESGVREESKEHNGVVQPETGKAPPSATIHVTETTISSTTIEDGAIKESSTVVIEQACVETPPVAFEVGQTIDASTTHTDTDNSQIRSGDTINEDSALSPATDDDLDDFWVTCDGQCDTSCHKWELPLYLCIFCVNTDLCPSCYTKRMAQNKGALKSFWRSYCGRDHRYIKGPIAGWKGVKDGIIRIEQDDGTLEATEVKEWLRTLKDERWVKAWDHFWLSQTNGRDVGF